MLEWTVQGSGGVTAPGGVKEKTGCGAECHGRVDKAMFVRRLDLVISKVCSN